ITWQELHCSARNAARPASGSPSGRRNPAADFGPASQPDSSATLSVATITIATLVTLSPLATLATLGALGRSVVFLIASSSSRASSPQRTAANPRAARPQLHSFTLGDPANPGQ